MASSSTGTELSGRLAPLPWSNGEFDVDGCAARLKASPVMRWHRDATSTGILPSCRLLFESFRLVAPRDQ